MKAIYDAARALIYPNEVNHQAGKGFATGSFRAKTREALRNFELAARGFRHKMTLPVFRVPMDAETYYKMSMKEMDAREHLFKMLFALGDALAQGQQPEARKFDSLLHAQDDMGWLLVYAEQIIKNLMLKQSSLKLNDKFDAYARVEFVQDKVVLNMTVTPNELSLYEEIDDAHRTITLDIDGRTLGGLVQLEKLARAAMKDLFKTVTEWKEFDDYYAYRY